MSKEIIYTGCQFKDNQAFMSFEYNEQTIEIPVGIVIANHFLMWFNKFNLPQKSTQYLDEL